MKGNLIFRLFACCVPVRGASRSIICDLQRHAYHFVPNDLHTILTTYRNCNLAEIKGHFDESCFCIIDDYFSFLIDRELGFWCDEPSSFPEMDLGWDSPLILSNAIIDVDESSTHDYADIFSQIDGLGCRSVQVRFYCAWELRRVEDEILGPTLRGRLRSLELMLKFSGSLEGGLSGLLSRNQRISSIVVHSAPEDRSSTIHGVRVSFRRDAVYSSEQCGQVHPTYFAPNVELFCEAQIFNTCLNRKVGIDARGEIKNCPSCTKGFGNIEKTRLECAVRSPEFQVVWNINKNLVKVCKDCEFRYICTDCRVFLSDPDDLYSKPAKCRYNPYTARWD